MGLGVMLTVLLAQTPSPVPIGPCLHEAAILYEPTPTVYPPGLPKGTVVFAVVTVTVGPDGSVQKAIMYKSTGTPDGDKEALRIARTTTYTPKVVDCKPTAGIYRLRVDFTPPQ